MKYIVNVRAIITTTGTSISIPDTWHQYDYQIQDGEITVRCDTTVHVEAENFPSAIEQAKLDAPNLGQSNAENEIEIWVDEAIDVSLVFKHKETGDQIQVQCEKTSMGYDDYTVYYHPQVNRFKLVHDIEPGDNVNVYCKGSTKLGMPWKGSIEELLNNNFN